MDRLIIIFYCFILNIVLSINLTAAVKISDPTKPPSSQIQSQIEITSINKNKPNLTAIFIKNGMKQAIINSRLYKEGERFNGKTITLIQKNTITLNQGSNATILTLTKPIKKIVYKKN